MIFFMHNCVSDSILLSKFLNIHILHKVFASLNIGVIGLFNSLFSTLLGCKLLLESLFCRLSDVELRSQGVVQRFYTFFSKIFLHVLFIFLNEEGLWYWQFLLLCTVLTIFHSFWSPIDRLFWTHHTSSVVISITTIGITEIWCLLVLSSNWNTTLSSVHWFFDNAIYTGPIALIILLRRLFHLPIFLPVLLVKQASIIAAFLKGTLRFNWRFIFCSICQTDFKFIRSQLLIAFGL